MLAKTKIVFHLKHKETGEEITLEFNVSKNPFKMLYNITKITKKLKNYDKTHKIVRVESNNPALETMLVSEIKRQEVSPGSVPEGMDIPKQFKKKFKDLKKKVKRK